MAQQDYEVALSFAGEDRQLAEELNTALKALSIKVFYDNDEKVTLWGKNVNDHLTDLYQKRSRFCIMLISEHYARKQWTTQERKAMQARALSQQLEYILPVRLDETEIPGFLPTIAYLRWPPETAISIAEAVASKLKLMSGTSEQNEDSVNSTTPSRVTHTIQQRQFAVDQIYSKVNRDRTWEYMYGYLSRTTGYLSKAVSEEQVVEKDFIRPISWLMAIASKVGIDIQDSFISRYPELCPSCIQNRCICFKTGKKPPIYMPAYKVKAILNDNRNIVSRRASQFGFDSAKDSISAVFPNNEIIWHFAGPSLHFSKLAEKVAKLHEAISGLVAGKKTLSAVSDEIADILAWLLGAWHIALPNQSVDQEFINYYYSGCPVCHSKVCTCDVYSGRAQNLFDSSIFSEIESDLASLLQETPKDSEDVAELRESIAIVIKTQDDPLARLTVYQISLKLTRMSNVHVGKDSATTVIPIITRILEKVKLAYRQ